MRCATCDGAGVPSKLDRHQQLAGSIPDNLCMMFTNLFHLAVLGVSVYVPSYERSNVVIKICN